MSPPMPAACCSHSARIAGEARAAIPLRETRHHRARERAEYVIRRDRRAARRKARRRIGESVRVMRAVHADAGRH